MKIEKYGVVKISKDGISVEDFEANGEGQVLIPHQFADFFLEWAHQRISEERENIKSGIDLVDGGGNKFYAKDGSLLEFDRALNIKS